MYTNYDESILTCGDHQVGYFYDPTVTCANDSVNEEKYFCGSSGYQLCDKRTYRYHCDWTRNPLKCAPGDLSSKYGEINYTEINYTTLISSFVLLHFSFVCLLVSVTVVVVIL